MTTFGAKIFERYANDIYGWAYRLLGRHHDALDVVQDVYLRWAKQLASEPPNQPRGWLRRVTLNRAIDLFRSRQTDPGPIGQAVALNATAATGEASDATAQRSELRSAIAAALETLPEMQRSVLVAKVFDDATFAVIAAELGLAVSTVKTHYLRAVRAMRDRLSARWADGGSS